MKIKVLRVVIITGLVICATFAEQWSDIRRLVQDEFYCPGKTITLVAFDVHPFINTITMKINNIKTYSIDTMLQDTTLNYHTVFTYDPSQQCLLKTMQYSAWSQSVASCKYFFKDSLGIGYSFGYATDRVSRFRQMIDSNDGWKPIGYTSSHAAGGDLFTSSNAKVDYHYNQSSPEPDSMHCFYQFSSNRSGTRYVYADYCLVYNPDSMLTSIEGSSNFTYIYQGDTTRSIFKETLQNTYNDSTRLVNALYTVVDTQTGKINLRLFYQYTNNEFGITEEMCSRWVDSLNEYALQRKATHSYDENGRIKKYSYVDMENERVVMHTYTYDSKNRVNTHSIMEDYSGGTSIWSLQRWSYDQETDGAQKDHCEQPQSIILKTQGNSLSICLNIKFHSAVRIGLYTAQGRIVGSIVNNTLMQPGTYTFNIRPSRLSSGVYYIIGTIGKTKMTHPIIWYR